VPSDMELENFHYVLQDLMDWDDSHMHLFKKGKMVYLPMHLMDEDPSVMKKEKYIKDYYKIKISDILKKEKDELVYIYDFGDRWTHDMVLEKILNISAHEKVPVCLDGENPCPPDDCGGIHGYYYIMEILKNPDHEYYEMYKEGEDYYIRHFDIDEINKRLQR